MNNRLLKTCVVIYTLLLLSISVIAHSGKTDSSGGHFNNSTGEYHYHHGYSAHYHYDIDGDGVIDCPYDFDDKTNHGSSNHITSSNSSNSRPSSLSNNSNGNSDNENNKLPIWYVVILIPVLLIPLSFMTVWFLYPINIIMFEILKSILEKMFKMYIDEDKIKKYAMFLLGSNL